jgi:hypothetical protein
MTDLVVGVRARIDGLSGRADLNGKTAKLLRYDRDAARWEVEVAGTREGVRIREANLTPVRQPKQSEQTGVYVNMTVDGRTVSIEPGALKRKFEAVVSRNGLGEGAKADAIADFLTSGEQAEVSTEEFARRFELSDEDASIFLAWVNVGISFKEQYMDPHQDKADAMTKEHVEALSRKKRNAKKTGVV